MLRKVVIVVLRTIQRNFFVSSNFVLICLICFILYMASNFLHNVSNVCKGTSERAETSVLRDFMIFVPLIL